VAQVSYWSEQMTNHAEDYAFPHGGATERRRLDLFAERLDPLTVRRIKALDLAAGARCLEVGGGRGSIARWLCEYVGPDGRATADGLLAGTRRLAAGGGLRLRCMAGRFRSDLGRASQCLA